MLRKIEKSRGYRDIDPENCWVEWNEYKKTKIIIFMANNTKKTSSILKNKTTFNPNLLLDC
ncbi:MAG: hypothetical protein H0U78_03990 [Rickettsiaceae bacterium]|nr:hypothetical protein [Rickettsiaceae bacterium]